MSTIKVTNIQNESSATVNMSLGTAGEVTLAKSPKLNGSTSGTLTIAAPAVAGTNTITFPAATDTVATLAATQTLTNKTLTSPTITGAVVSSMGSSVLTRATAQTQPASPSAVANVDFIGIPSWVKRVSVMFSEVSTSGTSNYIIQLGYGATPTYVTSGYLGSVVAGGGTATSFSTGFMLNNGSAATDAYSGIATITNITGNAWTMTSVLGITTNNANRYAAGNVSTVTVLTAIRITTVTGTDTFDAGTINIMYE